LVNQIVQPVNLEQKLQNNVIFSNKWQKQHQQFIE
jgi:hypothetical protein